MKTTERPAAAETAATGISRIETDADGQGANDVADDVTLRLVRSLSPHWTVPAGPTGRIVH